jgi:hypothetical protein
MAITGDQFNKQGPGGTYTPEEDVTQELPDGRQIQVAVKGTPIPYEKAVEAGLVKEAKAQGPAETKVKTPKETK